MDGISNLYNSNKSIFLNLVNNTNQKEITSNTIINIIKKIYFEQKLIITDIGAGNGVIANNILEYLGKNKITYIYNFIEPSIDLLNDFKNQKLFNNVFFINNYIQNIEIQNSDIFILSFVSQTISNKELIIDKIYKKLNKGGYIIFVNKSPKSIEFQLRESLGFSVRDINIEIKQIIEKLKFNYYSETKESLLYGVDKIIDMTPEGKNLLSMMLFKNFDLLNNSEKTIVLDIIKNNTKDGNIIRQDEYIFLYK
ncbi:MAG: hypothetical protein PHR68_03125 [Candidatus Gracilibacteria bacterium]|nr:hypothetical protein [Candidatus Gracilibacteria bacterium]